MRRVGVGSRNPVKLSAVHQAFAQVWPDEQWEVHGIAVDSGVNEQPRSGEESIAGARMRASEASRKVDAQYAVGMEGGLHEQGGEWFDIGWIVVRRDDGLEGMAPTVGIQIPMAVMKYVEEGDEVGAACDKVFGTRNSKQSDGAHGLLTNGTITRTDAYRDATIAALARFIHPELE